MNAGKFWMQDDRFLDRTKDIPADFYSTTTFSDRLIDYLKERDDKDTPFFAYLPFTAPHWPLQAPREIIKYKGVYNDGPAALRTRCLQRLVEIGLIDKNVEPAHMPTKNWDAMSPTEKTESARKMEAFSARVDLIDVNIGRVIKHLKETDEFDNTFILFMSDNGAEGAMLEAIPMMGSVGSVPRIIDKYYNNSILNMGMPNSYIWYGPEWAYASMAPSRGFKTWITKGGIRCPCLVHYPPFAKSASVTNSSSTVMDILPTILDLAGLLHPGTSFRGREVVPKRKSRAGGLFGIRAIREGHWKALFMMAPRDKDMWELYDMEKDPGEVHGLADDKPGQLARLVAHWERYYSETGMFDPGHEFRVTKI